MNFLSTLARLSVLLCIGSVALPAAAANNGVILIYHHVSSDTPPSTSVSPETFRTHLAHLAENHTVLPLKDMIEGLKNNQAIADNAVAITFDDGHLDILQQGHPILKEYGFPYTIFVNPELIGTRANQLTWEQLGQLQQEGVTVANHTLSHHHMLEKKDGEGNTDLLARQLKDINAAETLLEEKLGTSHKMVAYPYGEFNHALKTALLEQGYIGFGQHSGAIASFSDFGALPRFSAAGVYANLKTLAVKLDSLAMPVTNLAIPDPELAFSDLPPEQALTIDTSDMQVAQVNCFYNGKPLHIRKAENTVLLPLSTPLPPGRSRINCTAPSRAQPGRYYWYSQPWFVPTENGEWLE